MAEMAVGNYAAYPIEEANACYEAPNHDSADLCAQWRAALAAEKAAESAGFANWLSIIGAVLTVVGAGFIYATLIETKRSANAAESAVSETRRIGEAQARAYLTGVKAEIGYLSSGGS